MTRPQFGVTLEAGGCVVLLIGAILASFHHPAIMTCLVVGTGAFFLGRWFEKSG
ncbi:MAG TPA: hypothetical protein VN921_01415 [Chthoniobacterales bacterium]|nr:hypothetical protein [Chthoniobacterales bacterium]